MLEQLQLMEHLPMLVALRAGGDCPYPLIWDMYGITQNGSITRKGLKVLEYLEALAQVLDVPV
ncbi:hypothetical protein [Deinococcus cellulosilyticus]